MKEINHKMSGQHLYELFNLKCCYGWWRNDKYLYIGQTRKGISRVGNKHHVINKIVPIESTDEFHFWYCTTNEQLILLEQELILQFKPLLNSTHNPTPSNHVVITNSHDFINAENKSICQFCQNEFSAKTTWQVFCSPVCRETANNRARERKNRYYNLVPKICKCGIRFNGQKDLDEPLCALCIIKANELPPEPIKLPTLDEAKRIWSKQG